MRYAEYVMPHVRLKMPAMVEGAAQSPEAPHCAATRKSIPARMDAATWEGGGGGASAPTLEEEEEEEKECPLPLEEGEGAADLLVYGRISASSAHAVFTGLLGPSLYVLVKQER